MNEISRPIMAVGTALWLATSCGSPPEQATQEELKAVIQEYVDEYGCGVDETPSINLIDTTGTSREYAEALGVDPERVAVDGYVSIEGIFIRENIPPELQLATASHEASHFCADRNKTIQLESPINYRGDAEITSIDGLTAILNGTSQAQGNMQAITAIEEGVVDWLTNARSLEIDPDDDPLRSVRGLTDLLSKSRGIAKQEIADLLHSDDLYGFTARMYGIQKEEVSDEHITDLLCLYELTFQFQQVPPEYVIEDVLAVDGMMRCM